MKIIEPTFQIWGEEQYGPDYGISQLRKIETIARISHRSEDKQTLGSWERFIQAVVVDHGDWSLVEHAWETVIFRVDRGITHELVRHRLFGFTQESTRFVSYGGTMVKDFEFIKPTGLDSNQAVEIWTKQMTSAEVQYKLMTGYNVKPQVSRSILPNSLAATIAVTGNLRNWRHFFLMRTSKETHPDFRRVTDSLLEKFKSLYPILYDDITPGQRQIENLRKPR